MSKRQIFHWLLNSLRELMENRTFTWSESTLCKLLINYKRKTSNSTTEKSPSEVTSSIKGKQTQCASKCDTPRRIQDHSFSAPADRVWPESNCVETSGKSKMRGILQKNWAVLFNTVNFMTDKEAEEPSRLKCTKET